MECKSSIISLITFWMNDNEYVCLREDEILKNLKRFRLQTIIWSNEKVFNLKKVYFLLSFWTSIFRFLKLLSIVSSLRNWILMSTILWRDWIYSVDRNLFCLIMTAVEMIDKHFKIISVFELQTRDQFNWFAL